VGTGKRQNGKHAVGDAVQGCLPVSPSLHSAPSWCSHEDGMVWYGAVYAVMRPFYPVLKMLLPNYVTTTECVGHAMLKVTKQGLPKPILENRDINVMCAKDSK
jgi:hypothetical protein